MSGKQRLGLVAAAIVVAVVAVVLIVSTSDDKSKKKQTTSAAQATGTATGTKTTKAKPPEPPVERISIKNGTAEGGVQSFSVKKGDEVRLVVDTDESAPIHVHGYDIENPAEPGKPAEFKFEADRTGVYEIEIEDTSTQIGKLTVEQ